MPTFAQKQNQAQMPVPSNLAPSHTATVGPNLHAHPILHLQRTSGNQAVERLLQSDAEAFEVGSTTTASPRVGHDVSPIPIHPSAAGVIQTKLAINEPGDEHEQEADRVSEQVMRTPELHLQRACACGGECPECRAEQPGREHEHVQTKRIGSGDLGQTAVPPIVHDVLASPGQSLGAATRAFMEPRFGHDFSRVRVHTDAKAAGSARAVNALAYTVGRDVVFGAAQYAPGTRTGRALLAHELTHVVQQSGSAPTVSRLRLGSPHTAEEQEAHRVVADISREEPVNLRLKAAPGLVQRQLCGGQRLAPCPTAYISIPSDSGIGNAVGEWIGNQYLDAHGVSSYLLVDHRLYHLGRRLPRLSNTDLYLRTSKTGTPHPGIDPDVYTALQTGEFFKVLRPDILDSDRDHLYEIKPVRGAGAGPAQLNGYLRRLRQFAPTAPAWMGLGGRARKWQAGPWRPQEKFDVDVGSLKVIVCVYPDRTPGVLLYDILWCPPGRRRRPVREPASERAYERVPLQEPTQHRARVRLVGNHPYFEDLANRLPYMEAPPGRDFIVVIDDKIFRLVETEAERQYMEQQRRLLRPDPRGMPIIQAGRTLPYLAIIAGVVVVPLILTAVAPLVAGATAAVTTTATATTATATTAATAPAATTATATTATATTAATAPAATASTIVFPTTIAARVAPAATAAVTSAPAIPAAITAPTVTWSVAKFTSTTAIVASLIAGGIPKAQADPIAESLKPHIGKRVLAMADVTMTAELANAKPGQSISLEGQTFRAIIRLKTPD